jgi:two-component system response regulator (stage 0 sporulation protein F)
MSRPDRVLIVDDNLSICQTMAMILRKKGFEAEYATDGARALEMAKASPPDIVLLDIKLPGMDGVEVNRRLKAAAPKSRVVMITAYAVDEKIRQALDDGAERVFYKPLDIDGLLGHLGKCPGGRHDAGRGA